MGGICLTLGQRLGAAGTNWEQPGLNWEELGPNWNMTGLTGLYWSALVLTGAHAVAQQLLAALQQLGVRLPPVPQLQVQPLPQLRRLLPLADLSSGEGSAPLRHPRDP